ncbi:MAG: hypothetical protein LBR73_01595 [Oscillospiraceae bacterium]|jgi:hypothetical protein|nr:hypothetical protein [Oscillospiraceae bacterium]
MKTRKTTTAAKSFKRLLAALLAVMLTCGGISMGGSAAPLPSTVNLSSVYVLEIGEPYTPDTAIPANGALYVKYTPEDTAYYSISTDDPVGFSGMYDTVGYLYNFQGDKAIWAEPIVTDYDSNRGRHFKITKLLEAGVTYVVAVKFESSSTTGKVVVTLEKVGDADTGPNSNVNLNKDNVQPEYATASAIALDTAVAPWVGLAGQTMYYYFKAATGGTYSWIYEGETDAIGAFYTSSGARLSASDKADGFYATEELSAGLTYYLGVYLKDSAATAEPLEATLHLMTDNEIAEKAAADSLAGYTAAADALVADYKAIAAVHADSAAYLADVAIAAAAAVTNADSLTDLDAALAGLVLEYFSVEEQVTAAEQLLEAKEEDADNAIAAYAAENVITVAEAEAGTLPEYIQTEQALAAAAADVLAAAELALAQATHIHTYGDWVVDTAATHGTVGSRHKTCTLAEDAVCVGTDANGDDQTVTEEIAKTPDHTFGAWTVTTAATHAAVGIETRTCTVAGCTFANPSETREIPKLTTHEYGDWTITTPHTCTAEAIYSRICPVDGAIAESRSATDVGRTYAASAEGRPMGHDFSVFVETVAPTSDAEGYDVYKCSRCDVTENRNATPKVIFTTKYEANFWNWVLFFVCFGWIWMWFI